MAFSFSCAPIQSAFCSMIIGFLDQGLDFLNKARRLLDPLLNNIGSNLGRISIDLSNLNSMLNGIGNFELPNFSSDCLSMLKTAIENCPYLNENSLLNDLAGVINTLDKYLKTDLEDMLRNILPSVPGLPNEIDIVLDLNSLSNLCKNLKLDSLIPDMDKIFSCISSFCPNCNVASRRSSLNSFISDMSLSRNGTLDIEELLSRAGISVPEINSFINCNNALINKQEAISAAVADGAERSRTTTIPTTGDKYLTGEFDCNCGISSLLSVQVIDCTASILIQTSTKACMSPCAICEVTMTGTLGLEIELNSYLMYVNSYVGNATLTVLESGPVVLTSSIGTTMTIIGDLDIS